MSNNNKPNKPIMPSECVKALIDQGIPSWQIRKSGVSPQRIAKISRGEIPKKRGRKAKFIDEHRDYVVALAKADLE